MIVCKELVMTRSYRVHAALALGLAAGLPACAPSVQQEVAMGNQYAAQLRQELPLVEDATAVSAFQSSIAPLKRVAARQDLDWTPTR
jgi:predicted Zn-dependent protease